MESEEGTADQLEIYPSTLDDKPVALWHTCAIATQKGLDDNGAAPQVTIFMSTTR
jgi:hypothetical protein